MIFCSVNNIENKTQKAFFLEKIELYMRFVELIAKKYNLEAVKAESGELIKELMDLGIVAKIDDLEILKKMLDVKYADFIRALSIVINNRNKFGVSLDNLYNSKRKEKQQRQRVDKSPTLVDFFCGAGGLSLGFIQENFKVVLANDIEDVCIETYKYNHPELDSKKIIQGDIKQIVDNIDSYVNTQIDVVVGGPPCQGFSEANRQRVIDDPRNKLYKYFVKAVEKIGPKFVIMENVKGMLKVADQVVEDYSKLRTKKGYSYLVGYRVLNSVNFSVAQSRERLIYIAIRSDVAKKKKITPLLILDEIEQSCASKKHFVLDDALKNIKPLEASRIKNTNEIDNEITGKKIDINNYKKNNEYLQLINMGRNPLFTFNHKARYCSDINYEIYRRLEQGDDATNEKIKDIMPYAHRNHCFKDKYYKLVANRPCRTITAHLRMDCHSHIHPFQIRSITPREAARIQSFPDDYLFLGAYLKTYMQIGNAVPPMMARGIAFIIKKYLN